MKYLTKRNIWVYVILLGLLLSPLVNSSNQSSQSPTSSPTPTSSVSNSPEASDSPSPSAEAEVVETKPSKALRALDSLPVKGRAPKTGYERSKFADDWDSSFGCDTRNRILQRDLVEFELRSGSSCIVERGLLDDPFTGELISFVRGPVSSLEVQIDHVVSLSDAWQKGAQKLSSYQRFLFYNDPLNLLAVSGSANSQKSDSDAASWLPPNKGFRCKFVARQVAVKLKYELWVTEAEYQAIRGILIDCPSQRLPKG